MAAQSGTHARELDGGPPVAPWAPGPPPVPPPHDATAAEHEVWDLDGPDGSDRAFRRPIFERVPEAIARDLARAYRAEWNRAGRAAGNSLAHHVDERLAKLCAATLLQAFADDDLRGFAQRKAQANEWRLGQGHDPQKLYEALCFDARRLGLVPPQVGACGVTVEGALRRLADPRWWRRQMRTTAGRALEQVQREMGRVHKHAQPYVSNHAVQRRRGQRAWTRNLLESLEALNENDEAYTLAELQDRSVANPRNRCSELMVRLAGFQQAADEHGHVGEFVTLTCPSRFHCRYASNGAAVPQFDGSTPRQAQGWLQRVWARIRAEWSRQGITVYGQRIAEPNHDGTPHWHLILFVEPSQREALRRVIDHYALEEAGDEPGAQERRVRFEAIDRRRGSAVSYAAKYVAKNIDGFGVGGDRNGLAAADAAERIASWASTWGIRQFQQIGGPPVTVWRECRRLDGPIVTSAVLEDCRAAADAGDWHRYCTAQGGPNRRRMRQTAHIARAWTDEPNRYGEPRGNIAVGITDGCVTVQTQLHEWTIEFRAKADERGHAAFSTAGRGTHVKARWPARGP